MWVWVDRIGATIFDTSLAAGVLLGLAALVMVGCRQPARRCSLARAAILASLALMPLMVYGPWRSRIEVVGPLRTVLAPVLTASRPALNGTSLVPPSASRPAIASMPALVRWVPRALTLFYVLGAAASLAWLALGWWCSCWLIRRATLPTQATCDLYATLPLRVARWRPRLRVAARLRRPVLLGLLRPVILIPTELDRPEARERLRLTLLHELEHAERGDPWFSVSGSLSLAIWFFLPWAWWVTRQMRLDQEFLADHNAAFGFGPFGTYASSLVELAGPGHAQSEPVPAREFSIWGAGSALFQRVLMLVRCPYALETHAPRWWRWGLLPVVAFGTLLASGLTLRSAEPNTPLASSGADSSSVPSFRLTRLVIAESPPGADGWTPPHNLPLDLPPRFDLSLEIWAEQFDLAQTRVAGCRLGPPSNLSPSDSSPARWHKVHIRREPNQVTVQVDDQPLSADFDDGPVSTWLSIQPAPNRLGLVRNVLITW